MANTSFSPRKALSDICFLVVTVLYESRGGGGRERLTLSVQVESEGRKERREGRKEGREGVGILRVYCVKGACLFWRRCGGLEFLVWTVLSGGDEAALARQGAGGKTPHTIWMMVVIEGATHHAGRLWLAFVVVLLAFNVRYLHSTATIVRS